MKAIFVIINLLVTLTPAFAQIDPFDKNGLAIGGYDLVAYFKLNKAIKGSQAFHSTWKDHTYYFADAENQKSFATDPEKFLPQYEGYCALAVSYGKKISIDPETFKITDGKLYLFFHGNSGGRKINSIETWNKNETRLQKKADYLWPDVSKKEYKLGSTL